MHRNGNTLVLGTRECWSCDGTGHGMSPTPCPACGGTGQGPKGGRRGCKTCHGYGQKFVRSSTVPCSVCKGTLEVEETRTDHLPVELWNDIQIKVVPRRGAQTWNEAFLGLGCVWSCTDYGRTWARLREAILTSREEYEAVKAQIATEIREEGQKHLPQASSVVDKQMKFCNHLVVVVNRGGYSIRPVFKSLDEIEEALRKEPDEAQGTLIGNAVYRAGGHGTLAAAGALPTEEDDDG